jgi:hypothetical protein
MLQEDPINAKNRKELMSYKNNQYSEHIGSCIVNACGFKVCRCWKGHGL